MAWGGQRRVVYELGAMRTPRAGGATYKVAATGAALWDDSANFQKKRELASLVIVEFAGFLTYVTHFIYTIPFCPQNNSSNVLLFLF